MANVILIKRGLIANVDSATLQEGELALAYSDDKKSVELYVGDGNGGKIHLNPDPTGDISGVLASAKTYTDEEIDKLVNGAPEAMDTLNELAEAIAANDDIMDALEEAIGKKLAKPTVDGTAGQVLKLDEDGNPVWSDDNDTTYGKASDAIDGLMSKEDKAKLDGIEEGAEKNTVTGVKGEAEGTYRTGEINITKENIGLGNVNNTSDMDKPISTAVQEALNGVNTSLEGKMDVGVTIDGGTF